MNLYCAKHKLNRADEKIITYSMINAIDQFKDKFDCEPDIVKLLQENIPKTVIEYYKNKEQSNG